MKKETKKSNFIEVTPVIPTYCIQGRVVEMVVKRLLVPGERSCSKVVVQDRNGFCYIEDDNDELAGGSTLPQHEDTINDNFVYLLFENSDFDEDSTIDQLRFWGIEKVFRFGHCDRVLDIEEFLKRVKVQFVDQDEDYSDASFDEKARIFMN